ncbi:hypothetical protein PYW07_004922 [Mythimna separata]|uniref:Uncharacterized protein n=1 Tax=Mythimna separata TaxID=271217 RepID=A0AAD7YDI8_MYTSE|nr:hypothetical protein PYW07_004922 [Mythimna separata]
MISKRLNRQDPRHFVDIQVQTLVTVSNNFKLDFYFYQFSTNRYQPSFVEMHFKFCDMMQFDTIFGSAMLTAAGGQKCPYPPAFYDLKNMTISYVPKNFPFTKGRIYCNGTLTEGGVIRDVFRGSVDLEVKTWHKTKRN